MNLKIIETQLQKNNFLDENNIYIYASKKYLLEGICGRIKGLVLLSICKDTLYVHHANIDNSYGEQLAKIHIPDMKISEERLECLVESFLLIMTEKNIDLNCQQKLKNLWIFS